MFHIAEMKHHLSITQITCELIYIDKQEHLQKPSDKQYTISYVVNCTDHIQ